MRVRQTKRERGGDRGREEKGWRERKKERDREMERNREGEKERDREREGLFVCLVGFLTSSSTARLYRRRVLRL